MKTPSNSLNSLRTFGTRAGGKKYFYSLPALEESGLGPVSRLPVSLRVVLESLLRNCDGKRVTEADVTELVNWKAAHPAKVEIPFVVSRILLQDFTGVPLLVDLAAMRSAVEKIGREPGLIEPLVPVDLVVDHSVQVDRSGTPNAFVENLKIEFGRNRERYEFLKWGQQAFQTFGVVPPAIGIVHQVNLEYLARLIFAQKTEEGQVYYPDTLVGTDSHTTMINGLGILGWGVGGIEAEAGMLGQPVYFLTPEVVGVHLTGQLGEGVTATDMTLRITQMLREEKVVGKFVEFFGEGARNLTVADRATVANMAPEYGATCGFFPVDEASLKYMQATGRTQEQIDLIRDYYTAQGMFGIPLQGEVDYTKVIELDLAQIRPCVSGPKRPQDRIELPHLGQSFNTLFTASAKDGGFGLKEEDRAHREAVSLSEEELPSRHRSGSQEMLADGTAGAIWSEGEMANNRPTDIDSEGGTKVHVSGNGSCQIGHGSVLIAAITSCTNTSNPSVMMAAGLLAKKAVELGLDVPSYVKTSLAPGSRVVTDYLQETGLNVYLDKLGFQLVGYGCTTCIGNSGPLAAPIEEAIERGNLIGASVLSGNRNFEARVHSAVKANFLMSPPLVVAFALAGRVDIDLETEPLGTAFDGSSVYLKDIWPTLEEIEHEINRGLKPEMFRSKYESLDANPEWNAIEVTEGELYKWDDSSTYIQHPPYFENFSMDTQPIQSISGMRPLLILGDSVTTDHISPAGAFNDKTPAGKYLMSQGVEPLHFNSYGSRRGNDRIMTRGTFANVRIKNQLADGKEGGFTKLMPEGEVMAIHDACEEYKKRATPLIVFAGSDYGMGSSRDWAAKGTLLLGVKAVVATSFERIHRSNLIGMGVLPLQFADSGHSPASLGFDGSELFSLKGLSDSLVPGEHLELEIERSDGRIEAVSVLVRIDTPIEIEYYRHGGILPFVLREILKENRS
jgi:aconitate hydratase